MKKLSVLLALLLFALPATAATYSATTTAAQETIITRARGDWNAAVCALASLPASCTQAQFDAYVPAEGQAKPTGTVFATNSAFVTNTLVSVFLGWKSQQQAADKATWEAAKASATASQKDALCQAVGLAAGCLP